MPGATRHPFRTCSALRVVGEPLLSEAKWGGMMWSLAYPPGHGTEMASWGMKNGLFLREKSLSSLLVPVSASSDPTWIRMAPQGPTNILRAGQPCLDGEQGPAALRKPTLLPGAGWHTGPPIHADLFAGHREHKQEGEERGVKAGHQHILADSGGAGT